MTFFLTYLRSFGILSDISFDMVSDTSCDIFSDVSFDIFSDTSMIKFVKSCCHLSLPTFFIIENLTLWFFSKNIFHVTIVFQYRPYHHTWSYSYDEYLILIRMYLVFFDLTFGCMVRGLFNIYKIYILYIYFLALKWRA